MKNLSGFNFFLTLTLLIWGFSSIFGGFWHVPMVVAWAKDVKFGNA